MEVTIGIKRTAVMVILKNEDRFLLLKRKNEPNKNKFTPVGGKLDPFENPTDAAIRETFEETGFKLEKVKYVGSLIETSPQKYNWNCLVYLAEIPFEKAPPCNEGELQWIHKDNLLTVPTPPTDLAIYEFVLNGKPFMLNAEFDADLNMISMVEEIENKIILNSASQ
ncbi:MAG: NUDIX domain-containing protein [Bacteroidota bacterium]